MKAVAEDPQMTGIARHVVRGLPVKRPGRAGQQGVGGAAPVEQAGHFCLKCTAIAFQDDLRCIYCESHPPAEGWAALERANDPWLGQILGDRYLITRRDRKSTRLNSSHVRISYAVFCLKKKKKIKKKNRKQSN